MGKWMKFVLAAALAFTSVGCNAVTSSGDITVKDNDDVSYNKVMMQNIEKHKEIDAVGWLNNDQVFARQKGGFGRYDLKSHQVEMIYKNRDKYLNNVKLSPDKKHTFLITSNDEDSIKFYMLNLIT